MAEPPGGWEKGAIRWDRLFVVAGTIAFAFAMHHAALALFGATH